MSLMRVLVLAAASSIPAQYAMAIVGGQPVPATDQRYDAIGAVASWAALQTPQRPWGNATLIAPGVLLSCDHLMWGFQPNGTFTPPGQAFGVRFRRGPQGQTQWDVPVLRYKWLPNTQSAGTMVDMVLMFVDPALTAHLTPIPIETIEMPSRLQQEVILAGWGSDSSATCGMTGSAAILRYGSTAFCTNWTIPIQQNLPCAAGCVGPVGVNMWDSGSPILWDRPGQPLRVIGVITTHSGGPVIPFLEADRKQYLLEQIGQSVTATGTLDVTTGLGISSVGKYGSTSILSAGAPNAWVNEHTPILNTITPTYGATTISAYKTYFNQVNRIATIQTPPSHNGKVEGTLQMSVNVAGTDNTSLTLKVSGDATSLAKVTSSAQTPLDVERVAAVSQFLTDEMNGLYDFSDEPLRVSVPFDISASVPLKLQVDTSLAVQTTGNYLEQSASAWAIFRDANGNNVLDFADVPVGGPASVLINPDGSTEFWSQQLRVQSNGSNPPNGTTAQNRRYVLLGNGRHFLVVIGEASVVSIASVLGPGTKTDSDTRNTDANATLRYDALCASPDFNTDGVVNGQDVDDFLFVYSGGELVNRPWIDGWELDFNRDGSYPDPMDIDTFLRVWAGGRCAE